MRELIEHALDAASDTAAQAFLRASEVFWVDENDDSETVVKACGSAAGVDFEPEPAAGRLSVQVGDRRLDLAAAGAGPHETLLALNRVLRHSHQVRLALVSVGDDSLALVVLPIDQWRQLDDDIGDALAQVVWQLDDDLDPFEDLDDGDVLGAYTELLGEAPGCFGDCLARALANPDAVRMQKDDPADDLLQW